MKRILAAILALCMLSCLAACDNKTSGTIPVDENGGTAQPNQPTAPTTGNEKPVSDPDDGDDDAAAAALELLRQCMEDTAQAAAVAYLGYMDVSERGTDLNEWLWTNVPGMMADMPFLDSIPSERVLNGDYGDLYCIVPRYEDSSMAVNHVVWRSTGKGVFPQADDVLYRSENAEPLLVFVRWEEFSDEPDIEVIIVPNGGLEVKWYPVWNTDGYIEIPTGVNYEPMLLDFSGFSDINGIDYDGSTWLPPTDLGLSDTIWNCGSWMLEFHYGDGLPGYSGTADLSYQQEDGQEYRLVCSGGWRMDGECLRLELSGEGGTSVNGSFPVLIDLSGENLVIRRDVETYAGLPFFDDSATSMELMLSYG